VPRTISDYVVTEYGMSSKLGPRTFGKREELIFLGREIHEQRDKQAPCQKTAGEVERREPRPDDVADAT
jgi:cell division protease FtsH